MVRIREPLVAASQSLETVVDPFSPAGEAQVNGPDAKRFDAWTRRAVSLLEGLVHSNGLRHSTVADRHFREDGQSCAGSVVHQPPRRRPSLWTLNHDRWTRMDDAFGHACTMEMVWDIWSERHGRRLPGDHPDEVLDRCIFATSSARPGAASLSNCDDVFEQAAVARPGRRLRNGFRKLAHVDRP